MYLLSTFNKKVRGGDFMFYLCLCRACLCFKLVQVAEHMQQRPLGSHFSVGRRIRCNPGVIPVHRDTELFAYGGCGPVVSASHLTP